VLEGEIGLDSAEPVVKSGSSPRSLDDCEISQILNDQNGDTIGRLLSRILFIIPAAQHLSGDRRITNLKLGLKITFDAQSTAAGMILLT
jgi:hypothetical protein